MKRFFAAAALAALYLVSGCTLSPVSNDNAESEKQPFAITKSQSVSRTSEVALPENITLQAQSINEFSVKMYGKLATADENLFFSPYSITTALAMTAAGAVGPTKQQILDALQTSLEGVAFDAALNSIDQALIGHASMTDGLSLNIVNSTWMQSGWDFNISYLDHLSRYYGAGVNLMDFASKAEECRTVINDWIAGQTNDKILNLLPENSVTPSTVLVLTNAIHFLGDWLYAFDPALTAEKNFTIDGNSSIQTLLMQLNKPGEKVKMRYARINTTRALDFPYKGDRLAMTVFLPDEGTFAAFEQSLSLSGINELINALDTVKLAVSLPKFKFATGSMPLNQPLRALGMADAFEPSKADFSGIDGNIGLFITNVLHKAYISVDEEGTEAAAATAVTIAPTSVNPDEVIFVADRPFIFTIRDRATGTMLFMGKLVNPDTAQ